MWSWGMGEKAEDQWAETVADEAPREKARCSRLWASETKWSEDQRLLDLGILMKRGQVASADHLQQILMCKNLGLKQKDSQDFDISYH